MPNAIICDAIDRRLRIELTYPDHVRVLEPHLHGAGADGAELVLGWQVRGGPDVDPLGWKLLRLDETTDIQSIAKSAYVPRIGYVRDHEQFVKVFCRV